MTMKLAVMLLGGFKQARACLSWEDESGRRFTCSFLYKMLTFQSFATVGE